MFHTKFGPYIILVKVWESKIEYFAANWLNKKVESFDSDLYFGELC